MMIRVIRRILMQVKFEFAIDSNLSSFNMNREDKTPYAKMVVTVPIGAVR